MNTVMLTLLPGIAIIATLIVWFWKRKWQGRYEQAQDRVLTWEQIADRERVRRQDYERALGLSFWSTGAVDEELWQRAQQGEPIATEIVKIRMVREQTEGTHPFTPTDFTPQHRSH